MQLSEARVKTSPALVILPDHEEIEDRARVGVFEFLSKSFAYCPSDVIYWLSYFKSWRRFSEATDKLTTRNARLVRKEIEALIDAKFLAVEGSPEAHLHDEFLTNWGFGLPSALFHFATNNSDYSHASEAQQNLVQKMDHAPQPQCTWSVPGVKVSLPRPSQSKNSSLLSLMARRRTNRTSAGHELSLAELSDCLFAGLGIAGHVDTPYGPQVLSMTPSGGARNPFEAYVYVRRGSDLVPGYYHYNAMSHCLERIEQQPNEDHLASYFGNQEWVDDTAAIIVLVAVMERTMWKYQDANAYRVICIEAGHIAQNCMLAATAMGLTSCPTAALAHDRLTRLFSVPPGLTHSPVYAFTLDSSAHYPDRFVPNSAAGLDTPAYA